MHGEEDSCITFTYDSYKKDIVFLDIKVIADVYVKPSDHHQYLHYSSAHLYHTKKSVVLGQTWDSELVGYAVRRKILKIIKRE